MNQGIYTITHIKSGKQYVGSSVTIKRRFNRHKNELRKNIHRCSHLQRAWNKYGEEAFVFDIIEPIVDVDQILLREQHWMDALKKSKTLYNTCPKAGSPLGMRLTEEQRAKISKAHKGKIKGKDHVEAMRRGAQARIRSEAEIQQWAHNRLGKKNSLEHTTKAAAIRKANWMPGKYGGSSNPSAKKVSFQDVVFGCLKDAIASSNMSKYMLKKHPQFKYL